MAALVYYIFPNAIQLFIYVTTLSTVLFLVVWAMIIVAYLMYLKKHPEAHKNSKFKLIGGKPIAYIILAFFFFVFILLFFSDETRAAIYISPFWFIFLYFAVKSSLLNHDAHEILQRNRHSK
ncbi:hypothetical protein [Acinetobacter baumannii]